MPFTKLHSSILDSTVWEESNETRILWITMLAMSDQHGNVASSIPGLATRARLTIEATQVALAVLLGPDPFSRTKDEHGRRIAEIDGGWTLINFAKHRERSDPEDAREKARKRKQDQRDREKAVATVNTTKTLRDGYVYYVVMDDLVFIGLSKNPWARVKEMPFGGHLAAYELGGEQAYNSRIQQFVKSRKGGGWYYLSDEFRLLFTELDKPTTDSHTTSRQAEAEAEAEAEQKGNSLRELPTVSDRDQEAGISDAELAHHFSDAVGRAEAARIDREILAMDPTKPAGVRLGEGTVLLLEAEGDDGKTFPWRHLMGALARICPEIPMPTKGERRDFVMKRFWKQRGKTVGCFEVLAAMVQRSDFLMGRNGHTGNAGKPYTWGWIFDKDNKGRLRADRIMDGDYANEKMAFVIDKRAREAAPKMTRVVLGSPTAPVEVNLAETWNGQLRFKVVGTHAIGLPEVLDQRVA